jgi:PAS domain-containing protein
MKDENKTKSELIKELKTLRKERERGAFKNIFEYKEAEKVLKESEEKYQELFENMMDGLVLHR